MEQKGEYNDQGGEWRGVRECKKASRMLVGSDDEVPNRASPFIMWPTPQRTMPSLQTKSGSACIANPLYNEERRGTIT